MYIHSALDEQIPLDKDNISFITFDDLRIFKSNIVDDYIKKYTHDFGTFTYYKDITLFFNKEQSSLFNNLNECKISIYYDNNYLLNLSGYITDQNFDDFAGVYCNFRITNYFFDIINLDKNEKVKILHKRSLSSKLLDGKICSITNVNFKSGLLNVHEENLSFGNGIWFDEVEKIQLVEY